ncbi:MAG: outer membrane lipoprotein chaperone LolA [Candidatus Koribacter versatilis]|uniref:Outer-membrane lipoprotein carrier protein n=1 Tax=Candidatus Korobacter versatilis TaxID=658062 RepID=A0A932A6R5_9BACT|nr:outer membrane lipoprotein chaperone LolA [Candidatus Koribacter versatilis]
MVCLAADKSVPDIAKAVDEHYNHLQAFSADFTETYRGAGLTRSESGKLWLKKPGKMRWEYQQPREKLFVTDGSTAYFYVPGDQQARRAPVKELDDLRSPLRYLLGKTKLQKEFDGLDLAPKVAPLATGNIVLHGQPKSLAGRVNDVVLEIAPDHRIVRIIVEEVDGSTTEFRFSNIIENQPVEDARFRFTPPPGVQVIESNDVTP